MSIYAEIQNDVIVNVVVCDQQFATDQGLTQIDNLTPQPGIGWTLVNGTWTEPEVPVTQKNLITLQQHAQSALTNNGTFLAITSPTAAQAITQVQALTRQVNALIRITLGLFDSITDS